MTSLLVTQPDRELERRVRNALFSRTLLSSEKLAIAATAGTITLRGFVRSYYARQLLVHGCLRVPDMLRAIEAIAAKHDVRIGTFGHAGDGNLHPDMVFEHGDPTAEAKVDAVKKDLYQAAIDLGGTVTGEHGIGSSRREWLEIQKGADAVRVMRAIKAALDPLGILNPGRVV